MIRPNHALAVAVLATLYAVPLAAQDKPRYAGPTEHGFLLPNGWTVSPAGAQVSLTDMPLNILPLADGRHVLVATSGYNSHDVSLVDLEAKKVVGSERVKQSWFGLALDVESGTLWWSGGGGNLLHKFQVKGSELDRDGPAEDDSPKKPHAFKSGLAFDPRSRTLYSLDIDAGTITAIDTTGDKPEKSAQAGSRPYDVVLARNRSRLYVSDWAGRAVLALDPADLRVVAKIGVGEHPNQIAIGPSDDRIFVACSSSNCVSVIDTR